MLPALHLPVGTNFWEQTFNDEIDRLRVFGDGLRNDQFDAFIDKCMREPDELEAAFRDTYYVQDDWTENYPVKKSFIMLKELFVAYRGGFPDYTSDNNDFRHLQKEIWSPIDVLDVLSTPYTTVKLLGYGRHGATFVWTNISSSSILPKSGVIKIAVEVPLQIKEFYGINSGRSNFAHQRAHVPLGSLEQYMMSMPFVSRSDPVRAIVPVVQPVDNTKLTEPCTMLVTSFEPGNPCSLYGCSNKPEWAKDIDVRAMIKDADAMLRSVGVAHNDFDNFNVLVTYDRGPPPSASLKVIDFGNATPSGTVALRLGQP